MFVTTLIAAAASPALTRPLVDALRNAWGGGDAVWLSDVAAEFRMLSKPDNIKTVWADMQTLGVDVIVQPAEGRKKTLLLADMDSTMIQQECIDELAAHAGVGEKVADITARAMNGELEFHGALRERVALLEGLPVSVIEQIWNDRITLMPGGKTLLATMKANGAKAALVSGGFTEFTSRVSATLGFDHHRANVLVTDYGHLTGEVGDPILGADAKVQALRELTAEHGLTAADVLAVGDGTNDLPMLKLAGTGIALHAKPTVQAQANHCINHGDLTALLYLQGYAASEFQ